MRVSRIYTDQALQTGASVELDPRAARYVSQVLRLRSGQTLTLFNGDGTDYGAILTRCDRRSCVAQIDSRLAVEAEPTLQLHLGIGISRAERMDLAIQKSVELGVTTISPLQTERSVVQLKADRLAKRLAHWRGIAISACEQCGRNRIPGIAAPTALANWLTDQASGILLFHKADDTLATLGAPQGPFSLLIGPEGGLSEAERRQAVDSGLAAIRMGPRIMRTETAPLAALAAIQVLWGDFR